MIARAKRAGADSADALYVDSTAISAAQRLGEPEKVERAEEREVGLRVFIGKKQAVVSSADLRKERLGALAEQAVAMAKVVPPDRRSFILGLGTAAVQWGRTLSMSALRIGPMSFEYAIVAPASTITYSTARSKECQAGRTLR